jgi:SAM-dependent methyltransferase
MAQPLPAPPPWTLKTSASKGKPYYFNPLTGESSWTLPAAAGTAAHYDRVASSAGRSATDGLDAGARAAINFCKARLLAEAAAAPGGPAAPSSSWRSVVDLCCGRGGDLGKFRRLGVQSLLCVDVSPAALAEAQSRAAAAGPDGGGMRTAFLPPGDAAAAALPPGAADAVVCNLALHYFAESPGRLAALLATVARGLKPGGVFVGVMADARALLARGMRACVQGQRCFGNALYRVDMQDSLVRALHDGTTSASSFGLGYTFSLPQSGRMDACAEFVLDAEALRAAAAAAGLAYHGGENLSAMLERLHGLQEQRVAMRVPAQLRPEELELVSFYTTFRLCRG